MCGNAELNCEKAFYARVIKLKLGKDMTDCITQMAKDTFDVIFDAVSNLLSNNTNNSSHLSSNETLLSKLGKALDFKTLEKSEAKIESVLGVTMDELQTLIRFVIETLPDTIYLKENESVKNYASCLISQELPLFLAQEDKRSTDFVQNVKNFRSNILDAILNNTYVHTNQK